MGEVYEEPAPKSLCYSLAIAIPIGEGLELYP